MLTDLVPLRIKAGDGGTGRISFRREYRVPKGGPDGGNGGNGGHVVLRATAGLSTLQHFAGKKIFEAERGGDGGKKNMSGRAGEPLVLEVPVGTVVWQVTENQTAQIRRLRGAGILHLTKAKQVRLQRYEVEKPGQPLHEVGVARWDEPLLEPERVDELVREKRFDPEAWKLSALWTAAQPGDEIVICQGGFGGKGNDFFKHSGETTPLVAEFGSAGEERFVFLELKLLADVGLVGLPNAGKSTIFSRLTSARPKIADYPFTTREPHIGVWRDEQTKQDLVLADIPGLIEGASEGKGLGYQFLRHAENTRALVFVLVVPEDDLYAAEADKVIAEHVWQQLVLLRGEISAYNAQMTDKKRVVVLNKSDLYSADMIKAISAKFKRHKQELLVMSAATGEGMGEFQSQLRQIASQKI